MAANSEREDFLTEDAEIPGQRFCLLSFLSPEKVLAKKEAFYFGKYLEAFPFEIRTTALEQFLMNTVRAINEKVDAEVLRLEGQDLSGAAEVVRGSRIRVDTLMDDFQGFVKKNTEELRKSGLKDSYEEFVYKNKVKLEDEFFTLNEFRTTVRGLKIRGVQGSQAEAVARSKKLQKQDTLHNIFVGEVGKWLPWDPEPSEVAEQEYAEDQLNTLMKKYKENEEQREEFHQTRTRNVKKGTQVIGPAGETEAPPVDSNQFDSLFSGAPDLAIGRKMEASKND